MKINIYKCDNCKAEFEGMGGGKTCPSCNEASLKVIGEREINVEDSGCGGGCGHCKGC